jgi:hypothetical protein
MGLVGGPVPGKPVPRVLTGWKEIAEYLGTSVRSLQRYEHSSGLPVRRPTGNVRGSVMASAEELERWLKRQPTPQYNLDAARFSDLKVATLLAGVKHMEQLCGQLRQSRLMLRGSIAELRSTVSSGRLLRGGVKFSSPPR